MATRESPLRIIAVAGLVALACSLLVSTSVYLLRPIALAYSAVDRNRAILAAAGVPATDDGEVVERFLMLEIRIADLTADDFSDEVDAQAYDFRAAIEDPSLQVPIPPAQDVAGLGTRPRFMPVYALRQGGVIQRLVLPFYGRGMWSTIFGFVALEGDFETIAGIEFFEHGETPGIGDRIDSSDWRRTWIGKRLYDANGQFAFVIGGEPTASHEENRVDSITGATVTAQSVEKAVRYWLTEDGYAALLRRLKAGEIEF